MNIEIIITVIIPIIGAILTYILIPLVREKTTKEQRDNIMFWVEVAVIAAEKHFGEKTGDQKKLYVLSFLQERGIKLESEELDVIIDAVVEQIFNQERW